MGGSELRGSSGRNCVSPRWVDDDPEPSTVLVEEERQVSRSVEEADDLDVIATDLVENQVAWEPVRRPGANALGSRGAELPGTAGLGVLQEESDGIPNGVEQPLARSPAR